MSFYNTLKSHGLDIGITNGFNSTGHLMLSLDDESIVEAIKNKNIELFDALGFALNISDQIKAIHVFDRFEHYFTQGAGWERAFSGYTTNKLLEYKRQAEIVLWSDYSNESQRQEARIYLNAMDGDFPKYIPTERDAKTKKQEKYTRSRAKWLRLLIEDRPYQCQACGKEKDLRIKHLVSIMKGGETELSNLEFRCTKCVNK